MTDSTLSHTAPVVDRFLVAICAGEPLATNDLYVPEAMPAMPGTSRCAPAASMPW